MGVEFECLFQWCIYNFFLLLGEVIQININNHGSYTDYSLWIQKLRLSKLSDKACFTKMNYVLSFFFVFEQAGRGPEG